jgi:hypothetical protein
VAEAVGFVHSLVEQQVEVLEQEFAAILHGDRRRASSGRKIRGLAEDPWIPECAAADEHAADVLVSEPCEHLVGFNAIA